MWPKSNPQKRSSNIKKRSSELIFGLRSLNAAGVAAFFPNAAQKYPYSRIFLNAV